MSKVVSGVGKAVKGIVKGVKKAFKSITKSGLGKMLLIAGAIYLGGAALGAWESPFASINGVLAGSPAAAEAAAAGTSAAEATLSGAAATGESAAIGGELAGVAETAAAAGATPAAAEVVAASQAGTGIVGGVNPALIEAGTVGNAGLAMEQAALGAAPSGGGLIQNAITGIGNAASKVGTWVQKNPISAMMLGNTVSSAMQPDQLDLMNARAQKEMELYDWKQRYMSPNWNVGSVNLGFRPSDNQQLKTATGAPVYAPNGMINTAMKG